MFGVGRLVLLFGGTSMTALGLTNVVHHWNDRIELTNDENGLREWLEHTRNESCLSGMHRPFVTRNRQELKRFEDSFADQSFLFFKDSNELIRRTSSSSCVRISPLSSCPSTLKVSRRVSTLVVGGPPSLVVAVELIRSEKESSGELIYLNEKQRIPISNGSAWHLEEDAPTEAPTDYSPLRFLFSQLRRLFFSPIYLREIFLRGEFPWRTVDWIEWMKHPSHWWRALKIAVLYQWKIFKDDRNEVLRQVGEECAKNEIIFDRLNEEFNGKLLDEEKGSIIIARTKEEISLLSQLNVDLQREGKELKTISKKDFFSRFSFLPIGLKLVEKKHDRRLVSSFLNEFEDYLRRKNVETIDGQLMELFIDENNDQSPRFALLRRSNDDDNREELIQFSRSILSLGNQEIYSSSGRMFDVIGARGVSMLCHLYVPRGVRIPSLMVCGGTNHLTRLNSSPIHLDEGEDDLYLVRLTAGATITPNLSHSRTSFYDSTIAVGLIRSVQLTLGDRFDLRPLIIYGCNRQVSRHGQIHWIEPMKNVFIQYGAAGGGLTRAPDFIHQYIERERETE